MFNMHRPRSSLSLRLSPLFWPALSMTSWWSSYQESSHTRSSQSGPCVSQLHLLLASYSHNWVIKFETLSNWNC